MALTIQLLRRVYRPIWSPLVPWAPALIEMPVITTWKCHRDVDRLPSIGLSETPNGSSWNQQLESHRWEDGNEWRHQQLVLLACPSYCWWQARSDAQCLRFDARVALNPTMTIQLNMWCSAENLASCRDSHKPDEINGTLMTTRIELDLYRRNPQPAATFSSQLSAGL